MGPREERRDSPSANSGEPFHKFVRCKNWLEVLRSSPAKVQRAIIRASSADLIECICELSLNILNGNLQVDPQSLEVLRRNKTLLRRLAIAGPVGCQAGVQVQRQRGGGGARPGGRNAGVSGTTGRAARPVAARACQVSSSRQGPSGNQRRGRSDPWRGKRQILIQKGGGAFLTTLITSALGGLVGRVLSTLVQRPRPVPSSDPPAVQ